MQTLIDLSAVALGWVVGVAVFLVYIKLQSKLFGKGKL
jgi:hypothetical protein